MRLRIYAETSVMSYLAARPSRDPVQTARQFQSRALWEASDRFALFVSPVVVDEASRGNSASASRRLEYVNQLQVLELLPEADYLAQLLIERKALPPKALSDAAHIALATIHRVDAIASYNFRHIAGAFARRSIEVTLRQLGYESPVIATPEELLGGIHGQSKKK
jgi:predicted nucleic acid-binding protein